MKTNDNFRIMKLKILIILGSIFWASVGELVAQKKTENGKSACPILEINSSNVSCYSGSDGSAQLTVTDGSGDFTIEWSNGQTDVLTLTNLIAGYYHVNVTDNVSGCSKTAFVNITQPQPLQSNITVTEVNCYGDNTGAIEMSLSGGSMPYGVYWSNGANTQNINNLTAGDYSVTVTDSKGCVLTDEATIEQPAQAIAISSSVTEILCAGDSNGAVNIDVWGGTPPYAYTWNGGVYSSQDISGLSAGSFDLLITDDKGCEHSESFVLEEPPILEMTAAVSQNMCFGVNDGEIELSVSGGTQPYNYAWADGNNMLNINQAHMTELSNNQYFVTVSDANDCTVSDEFEITSPDALIIEISGTDVTFTGGSDGQINLEVTGGITPYTYSWSNGVTTQNNPDVPAGEYDVVVTDANGCSSQTSILIEEPLQPLTFSYIKTDATCHGASNGSVFAYPEGGTEPYLYNWSTGSSASYIYDLSAGSYSLTITDANGIEYSETIVVEQPAPFSVSQQLTEPSCYGLNDGIIQISVTGGTEPYTFKWYDADYALAGFSQNLNQAKAGDYTVIITDSLGCTAESMMSLEQPSEIQIGLDPDHVECAGEFTGSIETSVYGGIEPYSFQWSNGANGQMANDLSSGEYTLTVTDANGCSKISEIFISEAAPIEISLDPYDTGCIDQTDGFIYASVIGGNGGYEFSWSNGAVEKDIFNLPEGEYTLTVTDFLGCTGEATARVNKSGEGCIEVPSAFSPNADGINDSWVISNLDLYPDCLLQVFNKWGNLVLDSKGYPENWDGTVNGSALPSGTYYYILTIPSKGEVYKGSVSIVK